MNSAASFRTMFSAAFVGALNIATACGGEGSTPRACPPVLGTSSAALTSVPSFGDNPGGLSMFEHAPPSGRAGAVVVALHGCTQNADAYADAGWNELADKAGFGVVYPQQSVTNNLQKCFRWWEPSQVTRGEGEARSIASMVEAAKAKYGATRAYVTGLSAGAAMAVAMLAAYPDVFEAGAIMAGVPYGCAKTLGESLWCMGGKEKSAAEWVASLPELARSNPPRISIWQGDADNTVRPMNADQLVRQWSEANHLDSQAPATETVGTAVHSVFKNSAGAVRVERWSIPNMGHGVAVDPAEGCGKAGAFLLDEKLCSTKKAADFFGLLDASSAPTEPSDPASPSPPATAPPGAGAPNGNCAGSAS